MEDVAPQEPTQRSGKLAIPLSFEDAIRAALKIKPSRDEKHPAPAKIPRKKVRRSSGAVSRKPQQPGTAH